jgi:hypothetical protein
LRTSSGSLAIFAAILSRLVLRSGHLIWPLAFTAMDDAGAAEFGLT